MPTAPPNQNSNNLITQNQQIATSKPVKNKNHIHEKNTIKTKKEETSVENINTSNQK